MGVMYRNGSWYGVDSAEDYVLPIASKDILGGIRIGETLTIDEDGVLDVVDSGSDCECDNVGHFDRTTGTPTTGEIFNSYSGEIINKATGSYSHAEGSYSTASGTYSHAENLYTTASGNYSHAEGNYTFATGDGAHSEGKSTRAEGECSHAEGSSTTASTYQAHAEGLESTAGGNASHAEGYRTYAGNSYAHAEGEQTRATGLDSHTEGRKTEASAEQAHAEGLETKALDPGCHAEGYYTIAGAGNENNSAYAAHAEGNYSKAEANYTHAEGDHSEAKNTASHAEGYYTKATGIYTHAEGFNTIAEGAYSHAQGSYITAKGESQFAAGKYNIADSTSAVIIGGGTGESNRKNIFTIDWNGNIEAGVRDADGNITYGTINGVDITQIEGGGSGGDNPPYELPAATNTTLGGVKVGKGLSINDNGVLSANAQELTPATEETLGGIKIGNGLEVDEEGKLKVDFPDSYELATDPGLKIYDKAPDGSEGLPPGFSIIPYIENTSGTYVISDYYPTHNTRIITRSSFKRGIDDDGAIYGTRNESNKYFTLWVQYVNTYPEIRFENGSQTWNRIPSCKILDYIEDSIVEINACPSDGVYANGNKVQECTGGEFTAINPIHIFKVNGYNQAARVSKLYSMKIYENDILQRDLIPVLNESGNPGLYDLVTKVFIGPAESGVLKYDSNSVQKPEDTTKTIALLPATNNAIGGVKVSESAGLQVNESGELDLKIKIVPCTQEQYDALEVKDPNTLYLIGD